jgi:hypothetical protein
LTLTVCGDEICTKGTTTSTLKISGNYANFLISKNIYFFVLTHIGILLLVKTYPVYTDTDICLPKIFTIKFKTLTTTIPCTPWGQAMRLYMGQKARAFISELLFKA